MWLGSQYPDGHVSEDIPQTLREKSVELKKVLRSFATVVRAKFNGPLTYSAGTWELVDWGIFDMSASTTTAAERARRNMLQALSATGPISLSSLWKLVAAPTKEQLTAATAASCF